MLRRTRKKVHSPPSVGIEGTKARKTTRHKLDLLLESLVKDLADDGILSINHPALRTTLVDGRVNAMSRLVHAMPVVVPLLIIQDELLKVNSSRCQSEGRIKHLLMTVRKVTAVGNRKVSLTESKMLDEALDCWKRSTGLRPVVCLPHFLCISSLDVEFPIGIRKSVVDMIGVFVFVGELNIVVIILLITFTTRRRRSSRSTIGRAVSSGTQCLDLNHRRSVRRGE